MRRGNFENLVFNVRRDRKQRAVQDALLIPWRYLAASADNYVEWHTFVLWVRTIVEVAGDVPDGICAELRTRCPGFLDGHQSAKRQPIWKALEEWIAAKCFADANAEGWFGAIMYYAYKDLRLEQAWSLWQRAKADWRRTRPTQLPPFDQWKLQIAATYSLAQGGTEKARAVAAMENVERYRLQSAVNEAVEQRAVILWADCVSSPDQPLDPIVYAEIEKRCPIAIPVLPALSLWRAPILSRLIRRVNSEWRATARQEAWYAALRYQVANHPRYQRLLHYRQRCHDEWIRVRPISLPSFSAWLASADAYCVTRNA
jgi:hypothetical protein